MRRQGNGTVTQSEESITLMTPYRLPRHECTDPSRSFRMTTDAFLIMTPYRPRSFWMDARMLFEKDGKRNSNTEWRIYYLEWHLAVFLTTVTDPSLSLQDDAFRSPSLWRFPFPITSDALSFNRHSERRQKCCSRKTGNGIVTRSEESITLNDILPFSSPRQQILLRWYPKQWANSVSYFQSFVSDPQLTANGSQLSAIIPFPKD